MDAVAEANAREARALLGLECPWCGRPLKPLAGSGKVTGPNGVIPAPAMDVFYCTERIDCGYVAGDGMEGP